MFRDILLVLCIVGVALCIPLHKDEKKNELEKTNHKFFRSIDEMMNRLTIQLGQLPEELRGVFLDCMTEEMRVGKIEECQEKTREREESMTSGESEDEQTETTTVEEAEEEEETKKKDTVADKLKAIEMKREEFKEKLREMREKMRKFGRKTAKFGEEIEEKVQTTTEDTEDESAENERDGEIAENEKDGENAENERDGESAENKSDGEKAESTTEERDAETTTEEMRVETTEEPTTTVPRAVYKVRSLSSLSALPSLLRREYSPVSSMSDLILSFLRPKNSTDKTSLLEEVDRATQEDADSSSSPSDPVKFFDVEIGKEEETNKLRGSNLPLTNETFSLIKGLSDNKSSSTDEIKILSPRIGSILPPRNTKSKGLLSPSLFAMYENSREEQILSIPKVLNDLGLGTNEKKKVMEVALELAGARKVLAKEKKERREYRL